MSLYAVVMVSLFFYSVIISIFYMRITHANDIVEDIRGELEAYLRMEASDPEPVASPGAHEGHLKAGN